MSNNIVKPETKQKFDNLVEVKNPQELLSLLGSVIFGYSRKKNLILIEMLRDLGISDNKMALKMGISRQAFNQQYGKGVQHGNI